MSLDTTQPGIAAIIALLDAAGSAAAAQAAAISTSATALSTAIAALGAVARSGAYSDLTGKPSLGTQVTADTGWTAAAATGSKSIALSTWTAGGITSTIITGANALVGVSGLGTVLGNMDTQMAALTARLSQLEATLAAAKIPNA
jgi:hypothetical protein